MKLAVKLWKGGPMKMKDLVLVPSTTWIACKMVLSFASSPCEGAMGLFGMLRQ